MSAANNEKVWPMRVEVRFYANLIRYATEESKDDSVTIKAAAGSTVADVLSQIGVPDDVETTTSSRQCRVDYVGSTASSRRR